MVKKRRAIQESPSFNLSKPTRLLDSDGCGAHHSGGDVHAFFGNGDGDVHFAVAGRHDARLWIDAARAVVGAGGGSVFLAPVETVDAVEGQVDAFLGDGDHFVFHVKAVFDAADVLGFL